MTIKLTKEDITFIKWDGSENIQTEQDVKLAIKIALEDYDNGAFKVLLRDIMRARRRMAKSTKSLNRLPNRLVLPKGEITLAEGLKICQKLGYHLEPVAIKKKKKSSRKLPRPQAKC